MIDTQHAIGTSLRVEGERQEGMGGKNKKMMKPIERQSERHWEEKDVFDHH